MNNKKIEAQVLLARCMENKSLYGITIEKKNDNTWDMKYSYPISETRAKSEGFDKTVITADVIADPCYKGCPNCGRRGFVRCGFCGKITCYDDEESLECGWCGRDLNNISYCGPMELSTGVD